LIDQLLESISNNDLKRTTKLICR